MGLQTGHVGLNVTNVDRSKDFYQKVFGFDVIMEGREEGRHYVFLGHGGAIVITLWQQSEGVFATDRPGLHHLSFQLDNVDAVKEYEATLKGLGVKFLYEGIVPHREGAHSGGIFFEDPDGIRLEVYTPKGLSGDNAPNPDAPSCGFF